MKYLERLAFNLLIIGAEIGVLIALIAVFCHWWSPLASVLSVILCGGIVVVLLSIRKKFAYRRPFLSSTTWVVLGILVLSIIAGVPPLTSVKNKVVDIARDAFQSVPPIVAPENKSIIGKWQKVVDNKVSIMSPSIQFLRNGTVIIDDGHDVLVGTYRKLTDEYVKINMETIFFGVPITSIDTLKYKISSNRLTIRVNGRVTVYQRIED